MTVTLSSCSSHGDWDWGWSNRKTVDPAVKSGLPLCSVRRRLRWRPAAGWWRWCCRRARPSAAPCSCGICPPGWRTRWRSVAAGWDPHCQHRDTAQVKSGLIWLESMLDNQVYHTVLHRKQRTQSVLGLKTRHSKVNEMNTLNQDTDSWSSWGKQERLKCDQWETLPNHPLLAAMPTLVVTRELISDFWFSSVFYSYVFARLWRKPFSQTKHTSFGNSPIKKKDILPLRMLF